MMDRTASGLATAGSFAKGRIGLVPGANLPPARPQDLVRYAEAALAEGNQAMALETFTRLLQREEEHLQCAALVGLGRIGTQSAAQAVYPMLKSRNRKVAITARNVWKKFAEA
jgi:HEAT repeat protein